MRDPTWRSRTSSAGVTLVEFALVAPIFMVLFFGAIDGSLLVLSINQADHAADVASYQVAAQGDYYDSSTGDTADTLGWKAIQGSGINNPFVHVTGMTVTRALQISSGAPLPSGGTCAHPTCLVDDDSCSGACSDQCTSTGVCTGSWVPCGCGARNTTRANADYAKLDLHYSYTYFFAPSSTLNLTETRYFRLEPQS